MVKVWECSECGYEHEGPRPPRQCPECGADSDMFDLYEYDEEDWDEDWEDQDDTDEDW